MKFTTVQKAILALIAANVIWGAASPIFKLSLQNIPPFTLAFWRFFLGALLLLILLRKNAVLNLENRNDMYLLLGNALFGITANIFFFFLGLQRTLSINAPIIASATPIITFFLAILFLREKFRFKKFFGMILGSIGILLIIMEPLLLRGMNGSITGNIFLVIAALGAVGGTITGRKIFPRYNPMTVTFWAFLIGAASFFPLAVYEFASIPHLYTSLDLRGYTGIIFGAFFSSAAAYTLYNWGLSKISATDTVLFNYIDPVVGSMLAYILLHEPMTMPFLIGTFCIFGGIGMAEGRLHYHPFLKLYQEKQPKDKEITGKKSESGVADRSAILTKLFKHSME